jgi:hypothetical protein
MSNGSPGAPSERGTSESESGTSAAERGTSTAPVTFGALASVVALDYIRVTATQTAWLAGAYAERGLRTVATLQSSLAVTSQTYSKAYTNYASSVREARVEAVSRQEWINVFLGLGIGVGVGLVSGAILPATIAAVSFRALAAEVAGEATEAAIAGGVQASGGPLTADQGTNLEPTGVSPDALNSQFWERLNVLYRDAFRMLLHTQNLPHVLGGVEYVLGQFQVLRAGGKTDLSQAELVDMAESLQRVADPLTQLNAELSGRLSVLDQLQTQARAAPRYSDEQMECYIWILWMSTLDDNNSFLLDRDPIEDRLHKIGVLGPDSMLGVDFGRWTSKEDEVAALAAARREAAAIRDRFQALTGD